MKIIPFLIALFLSFPTLAQGVVSKEAQTSWGRPEKVPRRTGRVELIGATEEGTYLLRYEPFYFYNWTGSELRRAFIELYDTKSNLVRSVAMGAERGIMLEKIQMMGESIFVFTSDYQAGARTQRLFVQTLNIQTLHLNRDRRELATFEVDKKLSSRQLRFRYSPDESNLLVAIEKPKHKNEPEEYIFMVFNEKMEQVWQKEVTMPYPNEKFAFDNYYLDAAGNLYMTGKLYEKVRKGLFSTSAREKEDGSPNYKYIVTAWLDKGTRVREYPIELKAQFITDMTLRVTDDFHLVCGGFYSDNQGRYSIKGAFFMTIDPKNQQILRQGQRDFDAEIKSEFMSDKKAQKENSELASFRLSDIILRNDGGQVLIAERVYVRMHSVQSSRGFVSYYYSHHFEDLIVVNINPEGKIDWTAKIPKSYSYRSGTDQPYQFFESYSLFIKGEQMYFIFNDNIRNITEPRERQAHAFNDSRSGMQKSVATIAAVDRQGKTTRSILYYSSKEMVLLLPLVSMPASPDELLIYGEDARRKKYRLGVVSFK